MALAYTSLIIIFFSVSGFSEDPVVVLIPVEEVKKWYSLSLSLSLSLGRQNGDEASLSIILASLALLVKMLINPEPCGSFGLKFLYLFMLTVPSH